MNRAYSILQIKAVDDEKRIIEGIATTPEPDRMGDIVETDGIEFKLPLPFLYQHNSRQPIGTVVSAVVSKSGIAVKVQIAASGIAEFIDEAWSLIKAGLVRGLSIGFRSLEHAWMDDSDGVRFIRTEWLELSAVTIPAQASATITAVKSADSLLLAASGKEHGVVRLGTTANLPGVTGQPGRKSMKIISDQIKELEASIAANDLRLDGVIEKSEGRGMDEVEKEIVETAERENKIYLEKIDLLRKREKDLIDRATPVVQRMAGAPPAPSGLITVKSNLPKGTTFSRWVMAQVEAKGDRYRAPEIARHLWPDQPEVELILRAGVNAGTTTHTTWASPLVPAAQNIMLAEFLELLRPMTIIGRIPGLTHVPANVVVPMQTGGGTGYWVGEGAPKPVSALAFSSATLRWAKAVVLTVLSEELIRYSNPSAEAIVRDSIAKDLAQFIDAAFVSSTIASANVSPAGIRWNAPSSAASGVTAATFLADLRTALATFLAVNNKLSQLVILMSETTAMNVSSLVNGIGEEIYRDLKVTGGSIKGIPVIVSEAIGNNIIFVNASEILMADDGGIIIDSSNQASILMDDAPAASPTTSALVSLYQRNLVAIKAEQWITWAKARTTSVYVLTGVAYTG